MAAVEQYLKERAHSRIIREWYSGEVGRQTIVGDKPDLLVFAKEDMLDALDKGGVVAHAPATSPGGDGLMRNASLPAAGAAASSTSGNWNGRPSSPRRPPSPPRLAGSGRTHGSAPLPAVIVSVNQNPWGGFGSALPSPGTPGFGSAPISNLVPDASTAGAADTSASAADGSTADAEKSVTTSASGSGGKSGGGAGRPASAPATSLAFSQAHWKMSEAEWRALPMEYWARHGPSRDESEVAGYGALVTKYEIRPTWDPASNLIKRTAKPNVYEIHEDEVARREQEYFAAAAIHMVQVKQLLAEAAADADAMVAAAAAQAVAGGNSRATSGCSRPASGRASARDGSHSNSNSPRVSPATSPTRRPFSAPAAAHTQQRSRSSRASSANPARVSSSAARPGSSTGSPARGVSAGSSSGSGGLSPRSKASPSRPQLSSRNGSAHHRAALAAVIWEEGDGEGDAEEEMLAVGDIAGEDLADDKDFNCVPRSHIHSSGAPTAANPLLAAVVQQRASSARSGDRPHSAVSRPQSASASAQVHATTTIVPSTSGELPATMPSTSAALPAARPVAPAPAQQLGGSQPPRIMSAPLQQPHCLPAPAWMPRRAVVSAQPHTRTSLMAGGADANVWGPQGPPSLSRYPSSSGIPDLQTLGHITHRYFNSQLGQSPEPELDKDQAPQSDQDQRSRRTPATTRPHSAPRHPTNAAPVPFHPKLHTRPPSATRVGRPVSAQLSGQDEQVASRLMQPTAAFLGKVATATTAPMRPTSAHPTVGATGARMPPAPPAAAPRAGGVPVGAPIGTAAFGKAAYISPYAQAAGTQAAQRPRPQSALNTSQPRPVGTGTQWTSTAGPYSKPSTKRPLTAWQGAALPGASNTHISHKLVGTSAAEERVLREVTVSMLPKTDKSTGQVLARPDPTPFVMPPNMLRVMLSTYHHMSS